MHWRRNDTMDKKYAIQSTYRLSTTNNTKCKVSTTSSLDRKGISSTRIVKSANWSKKTTFKRFYKKELDNMYKVFNNNFAGSLLN